MEGRGEGRIDKKRKRQHELKRKKGTKETKKNLPEWREKEKDERGERRRGNTRTSDMRRKNR